MESFTPDQGEHAFSAMFDCHMRTCPDDSHIVKMQKNGKGVEAPIVCNMNILINNTNDERFWK